MHLRLNPASTRQLTMMTYPSPPSSSAPTYSSAAHNSQHPPSLTSTTPSDARHPARSLTTPTPPSSCRICPSSSRAQGAPPPPSSSPQPFSPTLPPRDRRARPLCLYHSSLIPLRHPIPPSYAQRPSPTQTSHGMEPHRPPPGRIRNPLAAPRRTSSPSRGNPGRHPGDPCTSGSTLRAPDSSP